MRRSLKQLAIVLALGGCGPKELNVEVQIVTSVCDSKVDPFTGVQFLRVRVSGDGLEVPLESVAPSSERVIKVPRIPAGTNRVIDVRAFDKDPGAGGKALSVGRSLPFDVPDVLDPMAPPVAISVFLRKVNAFTPPSSAAAPKECQRMKLPRAGHSATLLKNGKVFIAGGFGHTQQVTSPPTRLALSETELFNPATNMFETAREMAVANGQQKLPKAFHTATALVSGQVLLWGGESYSGGTANTVSPAAIILIYDPDENAYGVALARKPPEPAAIPRTKHKALLDKNGKVLIVGGETRTAGLVPVDQVEWFDPATNDYKVVGGVALPRLGPALALVKGGELVAVAGGTDGSAMVNEVVYFKWEATGFKREMLAAPPRLASPGRRGAAAATLRQGLDLVVLGGYSDPDPLKVTPVGSSEIVVTATSAVGAGPTVGGRGDSCATQLPDGSLIAIGGLAVDIPGAKGRSDGSSVILKSTGTGTAQAFSGPDLAVPRYLHTCTALRDGSVLVLGGLNDQITSRDVLQDAWIYQPAPTDP